MPAVFVGHGSPLNAIETNAFSLGWGEIGRMLPTPEVVLCVSAHWETLGTRVTAMQSPRTIHDFHGFPEELFDVEYNAPGSPELARRITQICHSSPVALDDEWGLDHGAWSVLRCMFPSAEIPVVQLSLDTKKSPAQHFALGRELAPLREEGVLILGSGNIVHNLKLLNWQGGAYDWAKEFDAKVATLIMANDHRGILELLNRREEIREAIPTAEHFLPLLYCLAVQEPGELVTFFAEQVIMGSLSMRSLYMY